MFLETQILKENFIFQETELSYISGNRNFKKLVIFQEVTFRARKSKIFYTIPYKEVKL